jgi:hypothetical protein
MMVFPLNRHKVVKDTLMDLVLLELLMHLELLLYLFLSLLVLPLVLEVLTVL